MNAPAKGQRLVSKHGEIWLVLRCRFAEHNPAFFSVDLIKLEDVEPTAHSVSLTQDEFEDFCRKHGITYPGC